MNRYLCSLILAALIPLSGYAADRDTRDIYQLDALDMSVEMPSDYVVFTRDISAEDPNLDAYGLSKADMETLMEERSIYLNAWDEDINFEIIVTMTDSSLDDFNLYGNTELNTLASSLKAGYAGSSAAVSSFDIYQHEQAKFIRIYFNQPGDYGTVFSLQYYTVYNNQAINIAMHAYSGTIDSSRELILKRIVDSVHFGTDPVKMPPAEETEPFVYHDKNAGLEFTVPANWVQTESTEEPERTDAAFVSTRKQMMNIMYESMDFWEDVREETQGNLLFSFSRKDIDHSFFTDSQLAEIMGISPDEVTNVEIGGKEYFQYTAKQNVPYLESNLEIIWTFLARVENARCYVFSFTGDSSSEYYRDFERLVASAKYPPVSSADSGRFTLFDLILSLLVTIALYSLPVLIYRFGFRKRPMEPKTAKKVTIIYAVIALIAMAVLVSVVEGRAASGGGIFLWSWVNYKVLTGGKDRAKPAIEGVSPPVEACGPGAGVDETGGGFPAEASAAGVSQEGRVEETENDVVYCSQCGAKLSRRHQFCHVCGAKIVR